MTGAPRSTVLLSLPDRGEALTAPDALFAGIVRDYGTQISRFAMGDEHNVAKRHQLPGDAARGLAESGGVQPAMQLEHVGVPDDA